jgi:hypothetical protein
LRLTDGGRLAFVHCERDRLLSESAAEPADEIFIEGGGANLTVGDDEEHVSASDCLNGFAANEAAELFSVATAGAGTLGRAGAEGTGSGGVGRAGDGG